jgi:hypothetical protein
MAHARRARASPTHVDAHQHPQPLLIGELEGNLAETDGGRGVVHEMERVEETQPLGVALVIHARREREAQHRDRDDADEQDQRRTQPPHDEEEDAVMARQRRHRAVSRFGGVAL